MLNSKKFWIIPVIIVFVGLVFFNKGETWQGFYYPDGCLVCEEDYIFSPVFDNLSGCLSWAANLKNQRQNPNDEFECGKNCVVEDYNMYKCGETLDELY